MHRASPLPDASNDGLSDDNATLDAALAFVDDYDLYDFDTVPEVGIVDVAASIPQPSHYGNTTESLLDTLSLMDQPCLPPAIASSPSQEMKPSISPPPEVPPTTAATTKRTSTNRSRTRQKDELVYLRSVVEELDGQLSTLKKRPDSTATTTTTKTETEPAEPLAFVWEELAARQYAQRQRAEVENVKLRTLLEEQIRVAKSLERVLKKRTMAEHFVPTTAKRVRKWKVATAVDEPSVFDDLVGTVEAMYSTVETVFADKRFASITQSLRDIQARSDDALGTIVEVFDANIAPFDLNKVSDAVWHHMGTQAFDPNAFHDEIVEISDSTIKREFGSVLDKPRFKGTFHGKLVARRFVEADRVLVIWAALVDPDKISDTSMDGLVMRQHGWTLMRPPPPGSVRSDRHATVTQSYHRIIPELDDDDDERDQRRKVGVLTNFVLNSIDFHLETGRQMIENLLFEEKWKTPGSTVSSSHEGALVATTATSCEVE